MHHEDCLHASCFISTNGSRVAPGSDEGAFAWLTLNYLLGQLGEDGEDTMAAIDLGGGSVQEAFALTDAQAKAAPDPLYITKLKGGGKEYSVYVHRSPCSLSASTKLLSGLCLSKQALLSMIDL